MKNFRNKAIAIAALVCVAMTSVTGCSSKGSSSESANYTTKEEITIEHVEDENGNAIITPFQYGKSSDLEGFTPNDDSDLNEEDPTESVTTKKTDSSSEDTTEIVSEVVEVTDASGETVTQENGEAVTEVVTKTISAGNKTSDNSKTTDSGDDSGNGNSGGSAETISVDDYQSYTDSMYAMWIDISQDGGYVFNDEVIRITFKLKDNIPDKDYAVRFNPDLSTYDAISLTPEVLQGTIRVGGDIDAQDVSGYTDFVAYGDNISANPGDTIDYYINFKNNPGLSAVLIWFYYDANAMEVVEVAPAGEFAEIASAKTQTGTKPQN